MTDKPSRGCVIGVVALAACLLAAMLVFVGVFLHFGWNLADRWISN